MRKALCVGIDSYENIKDLQGCVNDANGVKAALERNGDGTLNFSTKLMCATSETSYITRTALKDAIQELFADESEIAVFYYAGHGSYDNLGGYLCRLFLHLTFAGAANCRRLSLQNVPNGNTQVSRLHQRTGDGRQFLHAAPLSQQR